MADGTIDIDTQIDGDAAERGLRDLQSSLEATGKKMQDIGKGMTAGVTAPVLAVGGAAVKTAMDFESAQGKMQAQLGLTGAETEKYGAMAKDMWKNAFGENIGDVTNAISTVKQNLGELNDQDFQQVTEAAFTLQDVFEADIADSTKTASVMMENFGIDSAKAMDLMTVGFQKGGNFSGELLDTMTEYSPIFSSMGHSSEDMMNILISGAEAGAFNLDKVGDSVKEFNIRAKDGSKTTKEGFEAIGLNATEMGNAIAEGGDKGKNAFNATIAGLAAMDNETERTAAGVALFGTQWEDLEKDVILAMANGTNHVEGFHGATERAGAAAYDTFGSRMTTLWRTALDGLLPLGEMLLSIAEKYLPPLMDAVVKLAEWFAGLNSEFQMGIIVVGGILAALGPFLVVLGTIVGAIAPLMPALAKAWTLLSKLKTVFTVIRTAMLLLTGPVGIIIAIVTTLAILIYKNWDLVKEKTAAVFGWIGAFLPVLWEGIKAGAAIFLQFLVTAFSAGWELLKTVTSAVWNGILAAITFVWELIVAGVTMYINFVLTVITTIFNVILTVVTTIWNGILTAITFVWGLIVSGVTMYINLVQTVITTVLTVIVTVFQTIWNTILTVVQTVWNFIVTAIQTAINLVLTVITTVFNSIKTVITTALNLIKTGIVTAFNTYKTFITTTLGAIKSTVSTIFTAIKTFISTTLSAMKTVITTAWSSIKSFITTTISAIKSTIVTTFNNIKSAITTTMSGIKTTISNAFNSVLTTVKNLGSKFYSAGKGLIEQIIKGIKSMIGKVTGEMKSLAGKMRDFLPFSPAKVGPLSDLDKLDFGGPVSDSIKKAVPKVKAKLSHLLTMPKIQGPDSSRAAAAAPAPQKVTTTHGDTVNHFTVNTKEGQNVDVRALSQELHKLQKRDQRGAGRK